MLDGIVSLGRTYKFMGASTGQLKEMAFWFVDLPANFASMTDAHLQLGKFGEIKNIATYVARVGQYFSSTWPIGVSTGRSSVDGVEYRGSFGIDSTDKSQRQKRIPSQHESDLRDDHSRWRKEWSVFHWWNRKNLLGFSWTRCSTNGNSIVPQGRTKINVLDSNFSSSKQEDIPSAFQIRVAGCKGMVAIDPESTLDDYYIQVRESMEKFTSDDWNLEICEVARPCQCPSSGRWLTDIWLLFVLVTLTFNNQVIRLLRDLGNPDSVFRTFQNLGLNSWRVPEEQQSSILDIGLQKTISYAQTYVRRWAKRPFALLFF